MAFNGTLLTLGGTKFPTKWIYKESYHVTPHALDIDSTRDVNGQLQRNILKHTSCTVSFQTKPMHFEEYEEMWAFIRSKYIKPAEKKLRVSYYNFEKGGMESMDAYIPDVEHASDLVIGKDGLALSATIEFIGY